MADWAGSYILDPNALAGQGEITRPILAEGITAQPLDNENFPGWTGYYDTNGNQVAVTNSSGNMFVSANNDEGGYFQPIPGKDALQKAGIATGYTTGPDYSNINPNNTDWTPTSTKPDPSMMWLYGKNNQEGNPGPELHDTLWKAYNAKIKENPDLAGKILNPDALAYTQFVNNGHNENALPGYQWNIKDLTFQFLNAQNNNIAQVLGSPPPADLTKLPENAAALKQGYNDSQAAFAHDQTTGHGGLGNLGILGIVGGLALAVFAPELLAMIGTGGTTVAGSGMAAADSIAVGLQYANAAEALAAGIAPEALGLAATGTVESSILADLAAGALPEGAAIEGAATAAGGLPEAITGGLPSADAIGAAAGDISVAAPTASGAATSASPLSSISQGINSVKTSIFQPMMQALADAGIPYSVYSQVPTVLTPMITSTITSGNPLAGLSGGIAGVLASQLGIPPALAGTVTAMATGKDPTNAILSGAIGFAAGSAKDAGVPSDIVNAAATTMQGGNPATGYLSSLTGIPSAAIGAAVGALTGSGGSTTSPLSAVQVASPTGAPAASPAFLDSTPDTLNAPATSTTSATDPKFLDSTPDVLGGPLTAANKAKKSMQLAELTQIGSPLNYAAGGDVSFADQVKAMEKEQQSRLDTEPTLLVGTKASARAPMSLSPLKHIRERISPLGNMGGYADGGLPKKYSEAAPKGHDPEFITGVTGYYASGGGTGQSDDIPAMLHDGDYVMDADVVSSLGDGSSKAGREVLDGFRNQVPHRDGASGKPVPAKIADGEYVFPAGFVTALGGGDNKKGAKILDGLREKLRMHKRSAPASKIPPKSKSPLDYIAKA
jgi:hypothetical protein